MALVLLAAPAQREDKAFRPIIPRTWDDEAVAFLQLPLAVAKASPVHVSSKYYYAIPVRQIYKSYPIYAPGREPAGYMDWLKQQEPEIVFDTARLKTESDWIKAGELVFAAPIAYGGSLAILDVPEVRNRVWYEEAGVPVVRDGVMPFARYVVRKKGTIEAGNLSCAMCHTRVMPDGDIVTGAQGNFPFDHLIAFLIRSAAARDGDASTLDSQRQVVHLLFGSPWLRPNPLRRLLELPLKELVDTYEAIPPGVLARHGTSPLHPVQVPDLVGVQERRYLDRSGLVRHRSIGDLMRYAALNQDADLFASYGDFVPAGKDFHERPEPGVLSATVTSSSTLSPFTFIRYSRPRTRTSPTGWPGAGRRSSAARVAAGATHRRCTRTTS